jgi:hypothetical protein
MSETPDLLEGYLDMEPFAAQVKRDPRTVRRWTRQKNGLPHLYLGSRLLIHVPTARDWMMSRMRNKPGPPKKR